jgi:hypothetical protein
MSLNANRNRSPHSIKYERLAVFVFCQAGPLGIHPWRDRRCHIEASFFCVGGFNITIATVSL